MMLYVKLAIAAVISVAIGFAWIEMTPSAALQAITPITCIFNEPINPNHDAVLAHTFTLRNFGRETIRAIQINTSCPCLQATTEVKALPPGADCEIKCNWRIGAGNIMQRAVEIFVKDECGSKVKLQLSAASMPGVYINESALIMRPSINRTSYWGLVDFFIVADGKPAYPVISMTPNLGLAGINVSRHPTIRHQATYITRFTLKISCEKRYNSSDASLEVNTESDRRKLPVTFNE